MKSLRQTVSELMVTTHLITRELADYHVAAMSDDEISRRLQMYLGNGVGCHGSKNRADQRVFYPVFTSRDDDGMPVALNPVPGAPDGAKQPATVHARFGGKKPGPKSGSGLSPSPRSTFRAV